MDTNGTELCVRIVHMEVSVYYQGRVCMTFGLLLLSQLSLCPIIKGEVSERTDLIAVLSLNGVAVLNKKGAILIRCC